MGEIGKPENTDEGRVVLFPISRVQQAAIVFTLLFAWVGTQWLKGDGRRHSGRGNVEYPHPDIDKD